MIGFYSAEERKRKAAEAKAAAAVREATGQGEPRLADFYVPWYIGFGEGQFGNRMERLVCYDNADRMDFWKDGVTYTPVGDTIQTIIDTKDVNNLDGILQALDVRIGEACGDVHYVVNTHEQTRKTSSSNYFPVLHCDNSSIYDVSEFFMHFKMFVSEVVPIEDKEESVQLGEHVISPDLLHGVMYSFVAVVKGTENVLYPNLLHELPSAIQLLKNYATLSKYLLYEWEKVSVPLLNELKSLLAKFPEDFLAKLDGIPIQGGGDKIHAAKAEVNDILLYIEGTYLVSAVLTGTNNRRDKGGGGMYTVYNVLVENHRGASWMTEKRYSEFHTLWDKLRRSGVEVTAKLPKKKILHTPTVLANRRTELQTWLSEVVREHGDNVILVQFLAQAESRHMASADSALSVPEDGTEYYYTQTNTWIPITTGNNTKFFVEDNLAFLLKAGKCIDKYTGTSWKDMTGESKVQYNRENLEAKKCTFTSPFEIGNMYVFQSLYVPHGSFSSYPKLINLARKLDADRALCAPGIPDPLRRINLDELIQGNHTIEDLIEKIRNIISRISDEKDKESYEKILTDSLTHIDPKRKLGNYRSSSYEARFVVIRKKQSDQSEKKQYEKPTDAAMPL